MQTYEELIEYFQKTFSDFDGLANKHKQYDTGEYFFYTKDTSFLNEDVVCCFNEQFLLKRFYANKNGKKIEVSVWFEYRFYDVFKYVPDIFKQYKRALDVKDILE